MQLRLEHGAQQQDLARSSAQDGNLSGLGAERIHMKLSRLLHDRFKIFQAAATPHALPINLRPSTVRLVKSFEIESLNERRDTPRQQPRRAYEWPLPSYEWPIPAE